MALASPSLTYSIMAKGAERQSHNAADSRATIAAHVPNVAKLIDNQEFLSHACEMGHRCRSRLNRRWDFDRVLLAHDCCALERLGNARAATMMAGRGGPTRSVRSADSLP
jgi:hypothetical protein